MDQLTELPPPRKGAKAGYYPDPLGGLYARWWDGEEWKLQVGPKVKPGAPKGTALSPPTKVCRKCAAKSETFEGACPKCGRSYSLLSAWQIVAVSVGALLLTVGGCAACVAVGIKVGENELEKHAITRSEYQELKLGTPQATVEQRLGEPFDRFEFRGRDCVSYDEKDASFFSGLFFELCFEDGRLATKDSY